MEKIKIFIKSLKAQAGEELYLVSVFVLLFLSLTVKLEIPVLPHHDDITHACIGKMILKTGDWLTMHEGAQLSFLKPPLYFWIEAVFFKIFGFTDYAARLPSALCGFGTLILVFSISKRFWGKRTGIAVLMVMGSSLFFWKYSRKAMLDVPTAFSTSLAVYFFIKAEFEGRKWFYLLFGAATALGYYFKAIQGLYPLFIFPLYYLVSGQPKKIFAPAFLAGFLTAFSVIALWFVPELIKHGGEFLYSQCALGPIINRGIEGDSNLFFKPFIALLGLNIPWGIFNIYGIWLFAKAQKEKGTEAKPETLVLTWFFTVILILSVSKTFYIRYLIVAMVPFSIIGGAALEKLLYGEKYETAKKLFLVFVAGLFIKMTILPLSQNSEKGTNYIGLYRTINLVGINPEKVAVYKEKFYKLNQGLSYYADIIPKRHIGDSAGLAASISPGEAYVSSYQDFLELREDTVLGKKINLIASDWKNWALFSEKN